MSTVRPSDTVRPSNSALRNMSTVRPSDSALVALLRRLHAGDDDAGFVHRADVCSAAPEDLVAGLAPAPGTDQGDGGYSSVWYFYSPKRYKNIHGRRGGHRHREVGTGGDTCWRMEASPKEIEGAAECGGTFATFSYGSKGKGSSRSFARMGWCMVEYDVAGQGDYVLCKVYRSSSSLAKRKSSWPSTKAFSASSSCKKRKTMAAPSPSQQKNHLDREGQRVQQPLTAEMELGGEFVETEYGPMPVQLAQMSVDDLIGSMGTASDADILVSWRISAGSCSATWAPPDEDFFDGLPF